MTETATATLGLHNEPRLLIDIHETLIVSDTIGGVSPGDTIKYDIEVTNAGTTTLSSVVVTSSILDEQLER